MFKDRCAHFNFELSSLLITEWKTKTMLEGLISYVKWCCALNQAYGTILINK